MSARYSDNGTGAFSPDDVLVPSGAFVIAWFEQLPIGCGAIPAIVNLLAAL